MSRPDPFAEVYRVTTRLRPVPAGEADALARDLPVPLPAGYREYVTTFGEGELCDLLRVRTPARVREGIGTGAWEPETYAGCVRDGIDDPCELTPGDLAVAVTFATSAEGDSYLCCPRFGGVLFELPRHHHVVRRFDDGFPGVVADVVAWMHHDFAFFDHWDGRRHRNFAVRTDVGSDGLAGEVVRPWGAAAVRRSRPTHAGGVSDLFIGPVGGRLTLYLDPGSTSRLPHGCFEVAASYDPEHEADVAGFVTRVAVADDQTTAS